MVRTYAFNASSRSEFFEQYKHTAIPQPPPQHNNPQSNQTSNSHGSNFTTSYTNDNRQHPPSDTSMTISNSTTTSSSIPENNNQFENPYFPPLNQSNVYQSSFHQSMIDPIGSIVGLRLLYVNGQLVYVPVEPHINMMINKQFGSPGNGQPPPVMLPQIHQNVPIMAQNGGMVGQNGHQPFVHPQAVPVRSQSRQDINENRHDPSSYNTQYQQVPNQRQSANQQYRNNAMMSKFGSLPNLAQSKPFISSQEQHKLELAQQIEENKRRREMEKQKELELEQKEIRKWEEYQKRIREEDEREKRQIQEKARALELRNQQVYMKQQNDAQNRQREREERRREPPPQQQRYRQQYDQYSTENEEPLPVQKQHMRNSNSFSDYAEEQEHHVVSRPARQRNQQRREQDYSREPRPDSSQPRQTEWWEKKASWQDRADRHQSAVIPTLRGKPPAVPDSQRSGYDSSGNLGEHQSRPSSRATSSTQRSSDSQSEEPPRRNPSGRQSSNLGANTNPSATRRAPEAFTITA